MNNKERAKLIKDVLLKNVRINDDALAEIDRFGHIKFEKNDRKYRFKFLTNVIRWEVQTVHETTEYSPAQKEWVRLKSYNITDVFKLMVKRGEIELT